MARVLLMEDDRPLGLELANALADAGHEVVFVTTAEDARAELWHWDFDIVVTDLVVRKGGRPAPDGGLGLIGWIRHTTTSTPGLNYMPVIAMSGEQVGRAMEVLLPTAERIGADVVFEKPIDLPELFRAIVALTSAEKTA